MSLFISVVFGDIVEIVTPDDDGPLHLGGDDDTLEDLSSDGNTAGEGAFFVDVFRFDGFLGGFESQSDVLEVSDSGRSLFGE